MKAQKTVPITETELQIICDALYEAHKIAEFCLVANHRLLTQRGRIKGFERHYRYITLRSELFQRFQKR